MLASWSASCCFYNQGAGPGQDCPFFFPTSRVGQGGNFPTWAGRGPCRPRSQPRWQVALTEGTVHMYVACASV